MTSKYLKQEIEKLFHIDDLSDKCRKHHLVMARHLYFYLSKKYTTETSVEIGKTIGRDHATVLNGLRRFNQLLDSKDKEVLKYLEEVNNSVILVLKGNRTPQEQLQWHLEEAQRLQILIDQNEAQKQKIENEIKVNLSTNARKLKDNLLNLSLVFDNLREELLQWIKTKSVKHLENSVKLIGYDYITNFNTFSELNKAIR